MKGGEKMEPEDEKPKPKGPPPPPPPKPAEVPPHILKEIFDLKEKVGKLEGMLEVLLRQQK